MFAYKERKLRESANKRRASINDVDWNNGMNIISINDIISIIDIIYTDVLSYTWQFPLTLMTL